MLIHLQIKNFTIIDELELDFQQGMTVLTGETGAGKSIMIDALELCLGGRAEAKMVKENCERTDISCQFDLTKIKKAQKWLEEHDFATDETCLLRRVITADGRSRAYINGQATPLQQLREFGDFLVNIHGQHEHQSLLKRNTHRQLLDDHAAHSELLTQVKTLYQDWHAVQQQLTQLQTQQGQQAQQELLSYQVKELNDLALGETELAELEQEHKQLANGENLLTQCQQALTLVQDQEPLAALTCLHQAQQALQPLTSLASEINNAAELLNNAVIQTEEAANELKHYLDNLEMNPERLQQLEQRLQLIYDIARKHQVKPAELPALHQTLTQQLDQLTHSAEHVEQLQQQLTTLEKNYQTAAAKLTSSRQQAAKKLQLLITNSMHKLAMPGGKFSVEFSPVAAQQPHLYGNEKIEFFVSANPGQSLQPLNKVASGGELSRISLAIQVIAAQYDTTPTLIFDEVDVGIGGSTAAIVGQLLQKLGKKAQVLCITHLPQVAALGNQHLRVSKKIDKQKTTTMIAQLTAAERVTEIARMLGGVKITQQTLAHAEEMLGE